MRSHPPKHQENKKSGGDAFDSLLAEIFINRFRHKNNGSNINLVATVLTPSLPLISLLPNSRDESRLGYILKEEVKIEGEIICVILSGETDSLKPNSGQPILIYGHNICIRFHNERGSEHRVWEWHGHVLTCDENNSLSPFGELLREEERQSGDLALCGLIGKKTPIRPRLIGSISRAAGVFSYFAVLPR